MNKRLSTLALTTSLTLLSPAIALADKTTGEYPACGRAFWLEAMVEFQRTGAGDRYERWIDHGKCIELRKGLEVEVIKYYGEEQARRVEFELKGMRFFTVREAIAQSL